MALIPTIVERLEKSRDFAREKYEKVYQIVRQAKKLTRGITASEDFNSRAKTDKQNKIASDAERAAEPLALEVQELNAKTTAGEGELAIATSATAFLQSAKFVESPPTPFGTARSLREENELAARADLDNIATAANVATRLERAPIPRLQAEATTAAESGQWALYDAILTEALRRHEKEGNPEARRLATALESFVRKNPPLPVVAGQELVAEIAMFARAAQASMFALRTHRPDQSRTIVAGWNEERLNGRSGAIWFLTQPDETGERALETADGRRRGEAPSKGPVPPV